MLNELIDRLQPINVSNSEFFQKFDEDLGKDILGQMHSEFNSNFRKNLFKQTIQKEKDNNHMNPQKLVKPLTDFIENFEFRDDLFVTNNNPKTEEDLFDAVLALCNYIKFDAVKVLSFCQNQNTQLIPKEYKEILLDTIKFLPEKNKYHFEGQIVDTNDNIKRANQFCFYDTFAPTKHLETVNKNLELMSPKNSLLKVNWDNNVLIKIRLGYTIEFDADKFN